LPVAASQAPPGADYEGGWGNAGMEQRQAGFNVGVLAPASSQSKNSSFPKLFRQKK
jgi:hypothetical protein